MKETKKNIFIFLLLFSVMLYSASRAQEMPLPAGEQLNVLLKALTFDRNLKERRGERLTIGIVYQDSFKKSMQVKDEMIEAFKTIPIKEIFGYSLHVVPIDLRLISLEEAVTTQDVGILYITPLNSYDIQKISELSRRKGVITLSGVPQYSEQGIAVTVGKKGETPQIIINLDAARAEGADFSSQLLKMAKIVD
jgi:hypothetical protein